MPPGSVDEDGDGEQSGDGSEAVDSDEAETRRPRDPILILVRLVERLLRGIDRLYARLERLPGRARLGFGVLTFVSSTYFGTTIKRATDALVGHTVTALLNEFAAFSPGVRIVLVLIVVLVGQVAVANEKLTKIGENVENMTDDEAVTDGGVRTRQVDTTGAWAQGGAALGAGFGAFFGFAPIFGGMVFGAITGDLAEEWSAKRRKRRRMQTKLVRYLLRERVLAPETVDTATVRGWFPANEEGFVVDAIEELLRRDDSPVVRRSDGITLTGDSEAVAYLDRRGSRIPSAFAGPNRPPRPSDGSD